jgi:hypothetical protein
MTRKKRRSVKMSTEDSPRTHSRHIAPMEQIDKPEKMYSSPLHVCEWVRQYFEFIAIGLKRKMCVGSDDGLTSDHGGGGMVQRPMGRVL